MKSRYQTRDMLVADLRKILVIEKNAQPSPWARLSFEESLAKHQYCRVITDSEHGEKIAAYHIVCPILEELHILNLVVASEYQGQGIAHMLMHDILAIAEANTEINRLFLEVRESNKKAKQLYQQWQFKQIGIRKKYYRAGPEQERENALIMVKKLNA